MLERTDRLALAVTDADEAIASYAQIFDARVVDDRQDDLAVARRVTLQWGRDQMELYQPTGDGPAGEFISGGRTGLFAGGFSLADPAALASKLEARGTRVHDRGDGSFVIFPQDLDGTGTILSPRVERGRVGLNDKIWQITYAVPDLKKAVDHYCEIFGLTEMYTNIYDHPGFGYHGGITWFDARDGGLLDSLEYLEPFDETKAVARFVDRNHNGIYMASIETDDIPKIKERVESTGPGWQGTDFGGFIHPKRTHGALLGLVTYENWNKRRPLPGKEHR